MFVIVQLRVNLLKIHIQKGLYIGHHPFKFDFDRVHFIHKYRRYLLLNTFEHYLSSSSPFSITNINTVIHFRRKRNNHFVNRNLSNTVWYYRVRIV